MKTILTAIYLVSFSAAFLFALRNSIHMFQLNSYLNKTQANWAAKNFKSSFLKSLPFLISAIVFSLFCESISGAAISLILNFAALICYLPGKAKKPLVYTKRVVRLFLTCIIIYLAFMFVPVFMHEKTRFLFLILYIPVLFCAFLPVIGNIINSPVEKAVRHYYINMAKKKISSMKNLTVIGITGSYGKTSTKYYLEKLLSCEYNVLMTPASYNTTMGVVKTIRENLSATHDIFICEMGARSPGEIKEICDIVNPKIGIITSVGPCHLETFKTMENIVNTKFELFDAVPGDGKVFLNADNEYIYNKRSDKKIVYYGIDNKDADFIAEDISCSEKGTEFYIKNGDEKYKFVTKLLGRHNVQNITGCIAVARYLGIDFQKLVLPVKQLHGAPHRLSIINAGNLCTLIDDSFNSNPDGCRAALEVLSSFECEKIIVTPGMVELGEKQHELNFSFGKDIAKVCDKVFLVGEKQTKSIYDGIINANYNKNNVFVFKNVTDAINAAKAQDPYNKKAILIENDLPDNY